MLCRGVVLRVLCCVLLLQWYVNADASLANQRFCATRLMKMEYLAVRRLLLVTNGAHRSWRGRELEFT